MKYMLMIYLDEANFPAPTDPGFAAAMEQYFEFTDAARAAGVLVNGEELDSAETATTVRMHNGTVSLTDGPFVETKEQLGGYYVIDAANLDEAIRWAARIPAARDGAIEVRPIIDHG